MCKVNATEDAIFLLYSRTKSGGKFFIFGRDEKTFSLFMRKIELFTGKKPSFKQI